MFCLTCTWYQYKYVPGTRLVLLGQKSTGGSTRFQVPATLYGGDKMWERSFSTNEVYVFFEEALSELKWFFVSNFVITKNQIVYAFYSHLRKIISFPLPNSFWLGGQNYEKPYESWVSFSFSYTTRIGLSPYLLVSLWWHGNHIYLWYFFLIIVWK